CRNKGILFTAIDLNKPLGDQGPFDIVIHKVTWFSFFHYLKDYRQKHPEVTVIDPPAAIRHLSNRQSMLQYVADLKLSDFYGTVCIPRQMVIDRDPSSIALEVSKAGLKLPLVAKPLLVDGTAKSHQLSLAYDQFSLSELEPPLVLQEFVNHELPPHPLLERLAKELRCQMGLSLFNIDMIREHGSKDVFYVIDINYFPGYGKMPEYEHLFTDFLLSEAQSNKHKKRQGE
ncbi:Inositol-tetrakisphosphate 1-kinase 2, partial [Linum grandiflorum]